MSFLSNAKISAKIIGGFVSVALNYPGPGYHQLHQFRIARR